jgi:hypothetical protein
VVCAVIRNVALMEHEDQQLKLSILLKLVEVFINFCSFFFMFERMKKNLDGKLFAKLYGELNCNRNELKMISKICFTRNIFHNTRNTTGKIIGGNTL